MHYEQEQEIPKKKGPRLYLDGPQIEKYEIPPKEAASTDKAQSQGF